MQHNPGLEAAQHSPGPGPLNCAVNHQLLDVQGSQSQDHYTSLASIVFKECLFFTHVLPPCTSQSNDHFGLWSVGKKKRMLLIWRFCSLLSALFCWFVVGFFHVIPFSDNLVKLVIQKAWNTSRLRAEHTGKQPCTELTELFYLGFSQYSIFYILSVMGQPLLHWHFVFFLFRLEHTGQIWDIWLSNTECIQRNEK